MPVITSKEEKIRRAAKNQVNELYEDLCRSKEFTLDDAAEWLGCSKTNVFKIFHSGGVKAWQYECIRMHLQEGK